MSTLDLPFDMLEVPANGVASARVKQLKIGSRELHFPSQQIVRERTGLGCRYRNRGQHYHAQNRGMQTGTNVPIVQRDQLFPDCLNETSQALPAERAMRRCKSPPVPTRNLYARRFIEVLVTVE